MWSNVLDNLNRIAQIVEGWQEKELSELEKDVVLQKLSTIYEEVKFGSEGEVMLSLKSNGKDRAEMTPEEKLESVELSAVAPSDSLEEALPDEEEYVVTRTRIDRDILDSLYGYSSSKPQIVVGQESLEQRVESTLPEEEQSIEERYDEPLYEEEEELEPHYVEEEPESETSNFYGEQKGSTKREFDEPDYYEEDKNYYKEEESHPEDPQDGFVVVNIDEEERMEEESRSIGGDLPPFIVDAPEVEERSVEQQLPPQPRKPLVESRAESERRPASRPVQRERREIEPIPTRQPVQPNVFGDKKARVRGEQSAQTEVKRGTEVRPQPEQRRESEGVSSQRVGDEKPRKSSIGDAYQGNGKTLSDAFAENGERKKDMASKISAAQTVGIRQALGVNDRYLLIKELFDGNPNEYNATIAHLDQYRDLDEALIYIHENFSWDPNSEAVQLLMDVLTRKLS